MTGTQIVPAFHGDLVAADLIDLESSARRYETQAKAENTKRAYRAAWAHYLDWCDGKSLAPMPAEPRMVALYLSACADEGAKVSTMQIRLTVIGKAHRLAGSSFDAKHRDLSEVWEGIKRAVGMRPDRKEPVLMEDLRPMLKKLPDTLTGHRDRALLLIGFGGALRRSELVALCVEDVRTTRQGITLLIRKSKTDQRGEGWLIGIPFGRKPETCPAAALKAWLTAAGITSGPIFRPIAKGGRILDQQLTDRSAAQVVKDAVEAVGLDPKLYAGHSLRAGLATSAALAGQDLTSIMKQTRHESMEIARIYVRNADLFRNNVVSKLL
jgi:site-specific recombinase XerD